MESNSNEIDLNDLNDNFNDHFNFKPLTKGLGFHQKNTEINFVNNVRGGHLKTPTPIIMPKTLSHKVLSPSAPPKISKQKMSPQMIKNRDTNKDSSKSVNKEKTTLEIRALAFMIDVVLIGAVVASLFWIAGHFLGIHIDVKKEFIIMSEFSIVTMILCSFIFIFYFSILDLGQTFGKAFFNISLKSENGENLRFSQTFLRSIITLVSCVLLFLPLFLDFQSKLSDTRVVNS